MSLRELQHSFATALNDASASCPVRPAANLAVYRNNAEWQFRNALCLSFPVLRQRVGDDYFRQLTHLYRKECPSRSGDLHWVGREFPAFLARHLAGGDYAWLSDLARLEWARELASVAECRPPVGVESLAKFEASDLERLVFTLQPSLQLMTSEYPVLSVWLANQAGTASPVDQSLGSEQIMVLSRDDTVQLARLTPALFSYLTALAAGAPMGEAVATAGLDEAGVLNALRFCFAESLVCALSL